MAIDLSRFIQLRPHLYHLTAVANLPRIRSHRRLESAAVLLAKAGSPELLDRRREQHLLVSIDGMAVCLRDQEPLREGNIEFAEGWTFSRVVSMLNERVFFWPGSYIRHGPSDHGLRYFKRYEREAPAVLRVATEELLKANPSNVPEFCRYNSGSPRCSAGRRSPRGSDTFLTAALCDFLEREAVEIAFVGQAILPDSTTIRRYNWMSWDPLFEAEDRVESAVAAAFPQDQRAAVFDALGQYAGNEPAKVRLAILGLAKGNLGTVVKCVQDANEDYRDILSRAGCQERET